MSWWRVVRKSSVNYCQLKPTACPAGSLDVRPVDGGPPGSHIAIPARRGSYEPEAVFRQAGAFGRRPLRYAASVLPAGRTLPSRTPHARLSRCGTSIPQGRERRFFCRLKTTVPAPRTLWEPDSGELDRPCSPGWARQAMGETSSGSWRVSASPWVWSDPARRDRRDQAPVAGYCF